ncbi:acetyl-CoA acetyltransferase [Sporofaciens musculi]|uniref:acetyl-CoA acetyltransferase n=1 Tax=Sporofaciens musculi TaxID=2681861 RepID=UPI0025700F2F|nr:acetyl-CoA acetyltransferase [Sporofaciens musculi]
MSRVFILGGAQTDFERNWTKEGKNVIALLKEVMTDALVQVGLSFSDLEELNKNNRVACFVGNFIAENYINQGHLGALLTEVSPSLYGIPSARYEAACASSSVALDAAITKVKSEDYDLTIVVGWELMKTVDSKECGDILGRAAYYEKEGKEVLFPFPKLFSKLADETLAKYSVDEKRYMDALARISKINYDNAKRNPLAQTRKWFMNYEQARNRGTETNASIGGRLAVSDCSQVTDGAAVVVLASEKMVSELGIQNAPYVKGYGHRTAPMLFEKKINEKPDSKYILPWTRQTVLDAYKRSGLGVQDIDAFETHDCFTSSEYAAISAFGITEPGMEYGAIEEGIIAFDGMYPINPSGGLMGCGHPVGGSGCRMFLDIFKQVSCKAGGYQVIKNGKIPQNAMMLNIGGTATTNYVFIVGR